MEACWTLAWRAGRRAQQLVSGSVHLGFPQILNSEPTMLRVQSQVLGIQLEQSKTVAAFRTLSLLGEVDTHPTVTPLEPVNPP